MRNFVVATLSFVYLQSVENRQKSFVVENVGAGGGEDETFLCEQNNVSCRFNAKHDDVKSRNWKLSASENRSLSKLFSILKAKTIELSFFFLKRIAYFQIVRHKEKFLFFPTSLFFNISSRSSILALFENKFLSRK